MAFEWRLNKPPVGSLTTRNLFWLSLAVGISLFGISSILSDFSGDSKSPTKNVEYHFNVSWFNTAPDGMLKRVLGINNQFPGPTIRGRLGDFVRVHMTNLIQTRDSRSIHWCYGLGLGRPALSAQPQLTLAD